MATTISLNKDTKLRRRVGAGSTIIISPNLPKHFDQKAIMDKAKYHLFGKPPDNYAAVRIRIDARSENEAGPLALESINFLRGIWNLHFNLGTDRHSFIGKRPPVNPILLGPIHTLHNVDGKLATDLFWYEPDYIEPVKNVRINDRLFRFEKAVRRSLSSSPYGIKIEEAIKRYTKALDNRNLNAAFIELWSLLEHLTFTSDDRNKVTIRRTAFLFKDIDLHKQILNHLRIYRNRSVHWGYETEEIETMLYQLKFYVEELLVFHLKHSSLFQNMSSATEFLHLPTDLSELKKKNKMIRNAIKFRMPRPKKKT